MNRVANSPLITINLEHFYPKTDIVEFDLKDYLFMELILKEKDFRDALKAYDWATIEGKQVCVLCSTDAIIPVWAYMLVAAYVSEAGGFVFQGSSEQYLEAYYYSFIQSMDVSDYQDKMLVIKGCSEKPVPPIAYATLTARLQPIAKSIMYGEPCSTVPIYKKAKS